MSSETLDQIAERILEITRQIIELAQAGELDAFRDRIAERDALIARMETEPMEVTDADAARNTLIEARELNDQLSTQLQGEQQKLLDQKSQIKRGQRMQKAYGSNR